MDDFLIRAGAAGVGLALLAGPLGCLVVWRRMAYFGDTLAHSALLGVALGFLAGIDLNIGVVAVCLCIAVALTLLQEQRRLASDTLLGIVSHSTLSLGLIALAAMQTVRVDLLAYLFGDILAVTPTDLIAIWAGGAVVLGVLALIWRRLLALTVDEDLARVEGVPVRWIRLAFTLLIATTIALAMKIVGILLVTSLLIIPAATARRFARSPEMMAVLAALAGAASVLGGLAASLYADLPSGPAIVVTAAGLFLVGHLLPGARRG
ncbi:iron chelate uptake ABC transporter family permease subunit [Niveispirillum sp. BGYR6]|uniref:iron chelate uptake ABC transporter family permease subunit n=1 Tax=Niveispirillum sp. BGYR6 TaxID=2971249 RepID=UPI0022B998FB|nr:iron chelate uptake ABC transporter family permease subunit [Niveispirillum sp. BGYR6]MDG5496880.1 iron chelate uptake ABC transporter family permease subunit [Niveispirillum sp. BGYR6]